MKLHQPATRLKSPVLFLLFTFLFWSGSSGSGQAAAGFSPALSLLLFGGPDYCTDCSVYVGAGAGAAEQYAAEELVSHLNRAGLPVVKTTRYSPDEGPYIIIGTENDFAAGLARQPDEATLGEDGFEYRRRGKNLLIAGAHPRGTLNGVYHFLRTYVGYEWYAADTVKVPQCQGRPLPIPSSGRIHVPRFCFRSVFNPESGDNPDSSAFAGNDDDTAGGDTAARFRLNGQYGHKSDYIEPGLGYHRGILRQKHGFGLNALDVYNIGTNAGTAASTFTEALDGLRDRAAYRGVFGQSGLWYPRINHIDGSSRSEDPGDLDLVAANGGAAGAPLMDLVRRLAGEIEEEFPQAVLLGEAYLWSLQPPTDITLPANAGVAFAPIEMDWSQSLTGTNNSREAAYLDEWTRHTQHIWTWLYTTNFAGYLQPLPTIYPMMETIKQLDRIAAVEGVFLQDSGSPGGSFAALHAWVYSRLLWDPHLDADCLVREFCDGYYGPKAGGLIHQYIRELHTSQRDHPSPVTTKSSLTAPYLHSDFIIRADRIMQQAEEAAADNQLFLDHVKTERLGVDWVILHNGARLAAEAAEQGLSWPDDTPEKRQQRLDRFKDTVRNIARLDSFGEDVGTVNGMLTALATLRSIPQQVGLCTEETDCRDYQDLDFQLSGAELFNDDQASDLFAARMPGDDTRWHENGESNPPWGIQVPVKKLITEPGQWDVYAVIRVDKGAAADPADTALSLGVAPGPYSRDLALATLDDEKYHTVRLSGSPYRLHGDEVLSTDDVAVESIWFSPPASAAIEQMYVDRVFIVPGNTSGLSTDCPRDSGFTSSCRVMREYGLNTYMESSSLVADTAAEDGYAAFAAGGLPDNPWLISMPLERILPADGEWDLHVAVRVETRAAVGADEVVMLAGVENVGNNEVTMGDLDDGGGYRLIRLPGTRYTAGEDNAKSVYFQSTDNRIRLLVDYILAVPAAPAN